MNALQFKTPSFLNEVPKIDLVIFSSPISVTAINLEETANYLIDCQTKGVPNWVITLNWEMVSRAFISEEYRNSLTKATLFTPDGAGVLFWMMWKNLQKNHNLRPVRVAGVDLVYLIMNRIIGKDAKIAIIGGREHVNTLQRLNFPKQQTTLLWEGPVYENSMSQAISFAKSINENKTDFIFLAIPSTKQNWLGPELLKLCPHTTIIGVGGTFDYLSQRKRRAPMVIQHMHLEWLWRLCTEPRTASRYLVIYPLGLFLFFTSKLAQLCKK